MKYLSYRYIFPPRPSNAIPDEDLDSWDNGSLVGQPKLNGSNCTIYTNGVEFRVMNRHNQPLTRFELKDEVIKNLYKGNGEWLVINGEYMNKSKQDENRRTFNHKFVVFDILVLDGEYMVGKTFDERILILDGLYGQKECEKEYLYGISENIYRVKSYYGKFKEIFDKLTLIDMIEGLVNINLFSKLISIF